MASTTVQMNAIATPRPNYGGALVECTVKRSSIENVLSNELNMPASKCPSTNASLNESGYVTDSVHSTPMKERTDDASVSRYSHNPYTACVMGSAHDFVSQPPTRYQLAVEMKMMTEQQAVASSLYSSYSSPTHCMGSGEYSNYGMMTPTIGSPVVAPQSPATASPKFPSSTPTSRKSGASAASPRTSSSPVQKSAAKITRIYRNGRPVPVLPNGQPMFPADEEE